MYEIKEVTPEMAAELLARNVNNRKLNDKSVRFYADEMQRGDWQLNGETIKLNSDGNLIDGQHRLSAVVRSGCTVKMEFRGGLNGREMATIDTGKPRSAADVLYMKGLKYTQAQAEAARFIIAYDSNVVVRGRIESKISNERILKFVESNPSLVSHAHSCHEKAIKSLVSPSRALALWFLFDRHDEDMATKFFTSLATGAELSSNDPVLVLRNRLLASKLSARQHQLASREIIMLIIKAWNAWRAGKCVTRLTCGSKEQMQRIS